MKYMSILESPEKQLRRLVYKDFMRNAVGMNREVSQQIFEMREKELTKRYLKEHPQIANKYKRIKQMRTRIAIGGVVATLAIGGSSIYSLAGHKEVQRQNPEAVEQTEENYKEPVEEVTVVKEDFEAFYKELDKENNDEKRNQNIRDFAEKVVVAGYNEQNPENTIGEGDFYWTAVTGQVGIQRDKLGNITNYQLSAKEENKRETMQKQYYEFRINGNIVARYDTEGVEIKSDIINDTYFQKVVPLVKATENLQKEYASQYAGEQDKEKKRQAFEKTAGNLIQIEEQTKENEREQGE